MLYDLFAFGMVWAMPCVIAWIIYRTIRRIDLLERQAAKLQREMDFLGENVVFIEPSSQPGNGSVKRVK